MLYVGVIVVLIDHHGLQLTGWIFKYVTDGIASLLSTAFYQLSFQSLAFVLLLCDIDSPFRHSLFHTHLISLYTKHSLTSIIMHFLTKTFTLASMAGQALSIPAHHRVGDQLLP